MGRTTPGPSVFCSNLFGCGIEFCRRATGFCFYRHTGSRRIGYGVFASTSTLRSLCPRVFTLFGFSGLALTYLYFQIPLMVLIIGPTVASMGRWSDAAASLGASWWQYWRYVGVAVLWRPFLGALLLLFGNSFGAYAIAYALTSGQARLI